MVITLMSSGYGHGRRFKSTYVTCSVKNPILPPLNTMLDGMEHEQPHPGAEDHLVTLLRSLLEPILDMEQDGVKTYHLR